jgi:hypothetical protein
MESTFAGRLFKAQADVSNLEDEFCSLACGIMGFSADDPDSWLFSDFHFDSYDASFEIDGCHSDLKLTPEQRAKFWELGFSRCWLNSGDTERHYWASDACPEFQGFLKRKSDSVYLEGL